MDSGGSYRSVELATILEFTQSRSLQNLLKEFWGLIISNVSRQFAAFGKYRVELIHAVMTLIDLQFLYHCDATFAEAFHNVRRVRVSRKNSKMKLIISSLAFQHLHSYCADKIANLTNGRRNTEEIRISTFLRIPFQKFLLISNCLKGMFVLSDGFCLLMYMLDFLNYPSLRLWLSKTLLISTSNDLPFNSGNSSSNRMTSTALRFSWLFCKGLLSLHTLMSYAIQLRDFWVLNRMRESEVTTDVWAEDFPPPPLKQEDLKTGCSLCDSVKIENPHVIEVCGHVFCKACIDKELSFGKFCPDCKLVCDRRNLVKLIS